MNSVCTMLAAVIIQVNGLHLFWVLLLKLLKV